MQHVPHTDRGIWGLSLDGGTGNVSWLYTHCWKSLAQDIGSTSLVNDPPVLGLSPIFLPRLFVRLLSKRKEWGSTTPPPLMEVVT